MPITILLACLSCHLCADLVVVHIDEDDLPYSLSPQKYELSPSNYANSISKYENSPSKYSNSSTKYDNSPTKYDNTINGTRSILVEKDGRFYHTGYYVVNEDGVTNFYSRKGKRLFYSPKASVGLYDGEKGYFCGVLAKVSGKTKLVLTEKGQKVLMTAE